MKINNYPWVFLIAILVSTGHAAPIKDIFPGQEAEVISNVLVRRFYGPWNNIPKANGEFSDYGDYGVRVHDYQPSAEDEGPAADFPSNYGLAGVQPDTGYDPSQSGAESFGTGEAQGTGQETSGNVGQYSQPDETSNGYGVAPYGGEGYNQEEAQGNVHWTSA
ncbi:uncharacterized protein LOC107271585 [Cephus cinctus]|uniref:Uncharacterized protein LOC107271585 n=1 Tax=Cephus cinctus TaxID=211228 RepID=A0AAJ7C6L9_CEPCN|nr:uncharacterized protein LOC107271585 [Cephus cinctus]XP_015603249.1 uncharacterized protein LOC107271585 [Cephus cinctus]